MDIEMQEGQKVIEAVERAVAHHGTKREELIPILSDVNRELGYIPSEAFEELSRLMKVPTSQLFSVASFYQMLSTKPVGTHVIRFCESAPCHVVGGRQVWLAVQDALNLKDGETSADGKWTLTTVSCLGICGVGPVMMVDDDVYGNLKPDQIPGNCCYQNTLYGQAEPAYEDRFSVVRGFCLSALQVRAPSFSFSVQAYDILRFAQPVQAA